MLDYNKELFTKKLKQVFSSEDLVKASTILELARTRERERVQIAILKLSNGELKELRELVDLADRDYRDVLMWAEYPEQMKNDTWKMDDIEADNIQQKDRQQYFDWLSN